MRTFTRKNDPYARIKQRLEEWGEIRRDRMFYLGYNVHDLDFDAEVPRGIQQRNDVHSDPVYSEVSRMEYEYRKALTTDTAVKDLRPRWLRKLIIGRHKRWPDISDRQLASKLDMDHRFISNNLKIAYDILIETTEMLDRQRFGHLLQKKSA